MRAIRALAATSVGLGTASATMTVEGEIDLAATSDGVSTAIGDLAAELALGVVSDGTSTATGTLATPGEKTMGATSAGTSTASARLVKIISGITPDLGEIDREILTFRPDIEFVEPEVEERAVPAPLIGAPALDLPRVRALASSVATLAAAVQKKADVRARGLAIDLLVPADSAIIQAMRRHYPGADPTKITYQQYRDCKDAIRLHGLQAAQNANITKAEVDAAKPAEDPSGAGDTLASLANGGMRPETNKKGQIMEPLDIKKFQDDHIKILVNMIWKEFLRDIIRVTFGLPWLPEKIAY